MSKIKTITAVRKDKAEVLVDLIEQAGVAFKELDSASNELRQEVHPLGKTATSVFGCQVPGMDNLHDRVRNFIAFTLFGDAIGNNVDLLQATIDENASALQSEALYGK